MFHKMLFSSIALIGLTGLASAADMYVKAPAPIYVSTWTGCYVGGHVGYGKAQTSSFYTFYDDGIIPSLNWNSNDTYSPSGVVGGAQVGCQLQTGSFLWGLEGDWSSFNHSETHAYGSLQPGDPADNVTLTSSYSSLWSVRGRFGGIFSDVYHLYGTAGIAGAKSSFAFAAQDEALFNAGNFSTNPTGIVAGVGAEWKIWPSFVVGAEYLHYAFSKSTPMTPVEAIPNTSGPYFAGNNQVGTGAVDVIRLRASYLFNWGR